MLLKRKSIVVIGASGGIGEAVVLAAATKRAPGCGLRRRANVVTVYPAHLPPEGQLVVASVGTPGLAEESWTCRWRGQGGPSSSRLPSTPPRPGVDGSPVTPGPITRTRDVGGTHG